MSDHDPLTDLLTVLDTVNAVRSSFGLNAGWYDPEAQRAFYPAGNARLAHLASAIGHAEILGPDFRYPCMECYMAWLISSKGDSPRRCCTASEAATFRSHEIAERYR